MVRNAGRLAGQIAVLDARIAALCEPCERQIARLGGHPRLRRHQRPGPDRGDRRRHERLPGRRAPVLPGPRVRGRPKGKAMTGSGNPCIGSGPRRGRCRRRPDPGLPRRQVPAPGTGACRRKKARGAVARTRLVIAHALPPGPETEYRELGPGSCEQRADASRQARGHVHSLGRLGWEVTLGPLGPDTGELTARAG